MELSLGVQEVLDEIILGLRTLPDVFQAVLHSGSYPTDVCPNPIRISVVQEPHDRDLIGDQESDKCLLQTKHVPQRPCALGPPSHG